MGKSLLAIIRDQDPAILGALSEVFPHSFHRFCKWNITNKLGDKVGSVFQKKEAIEEFHLFLNHSDSIMEFENC